MGKDEVKVTVEINAAVDKAFSTFVDDFGEWWPSAYTWGQDVLKTIQIEPIAHGRCFEKGPFGFHIDWGRVVSVDRPMFIAFTWQISMKREPVPDPEKAGIVEVAFQTIDPVKTVVSLTHKHFSKYSNDFDKYLDAMNSPQGWPWIIEQFKTYMSPV